mmetsp:Transcript_3064/g.8326  ORF Transcript_3064/g.8326 Transcript_3064/m.8326 type:complete len:297 (+) Transcript_3064:422-1312(+)
MRVGRSWLDSDQFNTSWESMHLSRRLPTRHLWSASICRRMDSSPSMMHGADTISPNPNQMESRLLLPPPLLRRQMACRRIHGKGNRSTTSLKALHFPKSRSTCSQVITKQYVPIAWWTSGPASIPPSTSGRSKARSSRAWDGARWRKLSTLTTITPGCDPEQGCSRQDRARTRSQHSMTCPKPSTSPCSKTLTIPSPCTAAKQWANRHSSSAPASSTPSRMPCRAQGDRSATLGTSRCGCQPQASAFACTAAMPSQGQQSIRHAAGLVGQASLPSLAAQRHTSHKEVTEVPWGYSS